MIYKMTLKDSADEMTFDLLEVPIVDKDIEGAVDNVTLDGNQYTDYLWLKKQFIQKWSILCDDEYTRLRGFYTRQFENAGVPSYRLYYGDDIISYGTVEGKRINFTITGIEASMTLDTIKGNIEQARYTGKNLLQAKMPTTTYNGITCTNNGDGSWTLNGTATAGADFRINQSARTGSDNLQNYSGTYTLSCHELQNDMQIVVMQDGTWSQVLRMRNSNTPATATLSANDCFTYIYVAQGKTLNNLRIHPMIEKSATATAYEPYVGGIPAPNPSYPQPIETVTGRQTVTVAGKNLFNPTATPWGSKVAYNSSGTQVWWDGYYGIIEYQPVQPNTQYTFSNSAGKPILYGLVFYDANKTMLSTVPSATTTFTTPANCAYIRFAIQNDSAPTWAQLELGNQASAYKPYEGQDYEINLGKNLFDTTAENGGIDASGGTFVSNTQLRTVGYVEVEPNTQYTFSNTNNLVLDRVCYYNGSKTFIERGAYLNTATFTTPNNNCRYARLVIRASGGGNIAPSDLVNPQIEKGSTASSYSAYFEPIELCKIGTYQDRIYKENGKWYLHKEVGHYDITGAEDWTRSGRTTSTVFAGVLANDTLTTLMQIGANECFINRFIYKGANVEAGGYDVYNYSSAGVVRAFVLYVSADSASDITAFKTWLTNNPTAVYYVLATPTTTEITNEEVLEGLEALQDEAISVGQHNIYTDTPNALPTLTFDLTEYLSQSTTIIPETAVRLTLTDGGVINACGCRKDVQLTMRETIE